MVDDAESTIRFDVLFFATTRELAGCSTTTVTAPRGSSVADVRDLLLTRFPALEGRLAVCRMAVNEEFADDGTAVPPGAVVAVIPPVSGG